MRGFEIPFLTVLLYSTFTTFVTPNPITQYTRSEIITNRHDEYEPILPRHSAIAALSFTNFHPVRKRDNGILGDGWSMQLIHAESFLPVQSAAADLAAFYLYVMQEALEYTLSNHHGYHALALTQGRLALSWRCPQINIPWLLIHTFASQMLEATLRGYTGQFEMRFTHLQGLAIDVVLEVGPFAVQALGTVHGDAHSATNAGGPRRRSSS